MYDVHCALWTGRTQADVKWNYILAAHGLIENDDMQFIRLSAGNYQSDFIDHSAVYRLPEFHIRRRLRQYITFAAYPIDAPVWVRFCVCPNEKWNGEGIKNRKKKKPFRCKIMQLHNQMHPRTQTSAFRNYNSPLLFRFYYAAENWFFSFHFLFLFSFFLGPFDSDCSVFCSSVASRIKFVAASGNSSWAA